MKVTTKKGDKGKTSLFDRTGVSKHDPLIVLIGENDEVQALLGLFKTNLPNHPTRDYITRLQRHIYLIMGELSHAAPVPLHSLETWVKQLEQKGNELMKRTAIGNHFVIPGENMHEAWCQVTRVAVRRLERGYSAYAEKHHEVKKFIPFFNRLSDYLFILGQSFL